MFFINKQKKKKYLQKWKNNFIRAFAISIIFFIILYIPLNFWDDFFLVKEWLQQVNCVSHFPEKKKEKIMS